MGGFGFLFRFKGFFLLLQNTFVIFEGFFALNGNHSKYVKVYKAYIGGIIVVSWFLV